MLIICLILCAAVIAAGVLLYKKSSKYTASADSPKRLAIIAAAILVLSLGLEATLFNINFYASHSYNEISLTDRLDVPKNADGSLTLDSQNGTLTFPAVNTEIKNIRITLAGGGEENVNVQFKLTDEANERFYSVPERTVYSGVEKSHYINIHTAGVSKELAAEFILDAGEEVNIADISVNVQRPFDFSLIRIAIAAAVLILFFIFRPASALYKKTVGENTSEARSLMYALLCFEAAVIIILVSLNPLFNSLSKTQSGIGFAPLPMENHNQYDELAQAVLKGRLYIDNGDVPEFLKEMKNPYDTTARTYAEYISGEDARWDVAYFNGHYYVYFGIVPLILMYLPFRAVFAAPFPTFIGIAVFCVLFSLGAFNLLLLICKKKFPGVSLGVLLLMSLTFVNCCGMTFLAKRPDFYSVPIICGMTFTVWGLYWWLRALDETGHRLLRFFAGALCMALVAGCRPQMLLISVLALPLFFKHFFTDSHILKKEGIKELVSLGVPYIAVAAVIMIYNYVRFASPFDFGSAYNLTTNDVTHRGFDFGRIGLGLFTYLFQSPKFTAVFPFLEKVSIVTAYQGKTVYENCFGGLVTSLPVLWFLFALPGAKEKLKEKKLFAFTALLCLAGAALVIADTEAGGLLQRYYSDFGFVFFLAAALIIFSLFEKYADSNAERKILQPLFILSCFFGIFYAVCLAFSVSDVTIDTQAPELFGTLFEAVQFWL